jgi:hypothetical protein
MEVMNAETHLGRICRGTGREPKYSFPVSYLRPK